MKEISGYTLEKFKAANGQPIQVAVGENGWGYATQEKWAEAISLPDSRKVQFFSTLPYHAQVLEREHVGGHWRATIQGKEVFRWHVVEEAMEAFYHANTKYRGMSSPPFGEREAFDFFHRIRLLKHWGRDLQEQAIANRIRKTAAPVKDDVSALADVISRSIGPHLDNHRQRLEDHEERISKIEDDSKQRKDPDEFITVREACLELCHDPEQLVSGKRNLQNITGELLAKRGADKGLPRAYRPSGSSAITRVNTWRRSEVHDAVKEAVKLRDDLPLFMSSDERRASSSHLGPRYEYDIFLSYSTKDELRADQLRQIVQGAAFKCFMASRSLSPGRKWAEEIRKALQNSYEVCVLCTPESLSSQWVLTECGAAWVLGRPMVPVLFRVAPSQLPDRLREMQAVDFVDFSDYVAHLKGRRTASN